MTNRTLKNDIHETDDEDIDVETVASYLDIKDGGKAPSALIVLCGLYNAACRRPDGVFVVSPTALKN